MKRESFNYLRTMRQIKTGLELARKPNPIQTTSARLRAPFEKELAPEINEKAIALALEHEKRKFVRQNTALARSRQKLKDARTKLFATKTKNERLMVLRHALHKQRWLDTEDMQAPSAPNPGGEGASRERRGRVHRAVKVRRT